MAVYQNNVLKEVPIYGSNYLGNVLVTLTDGSANVLSYSDYFPFGTKISDRSWNREGYRYGFNGKENDTDLNGSQLIQDYGFRVYNPVIGKFLSVDPLTKSYPWYTPYQFAGNKPIEAIDLDGLEEKYSITYEESKEKPILGLQGVPGVTIKPIINNLVPKPQPPLTTPPKYSFRILSLARLSPLIFLSLEGEAEEKKRIARWNLELLEDKINQGEALSDSDLADYKDLLWIVRKIYLGKDQNQLSVGNVQSDIVYRGSDSSPEDKFENGFSAKGNNYDLQDHVMNNPDDSGYISTTKVKDSAIDYGDYVYEIDYKGGGKDVNLIFGSDNKWRYENEVSIPDHISPSSIKGVYKVNNDNTLGDFIPNPNYKQ